jgi:AraC-like DNA-binding protein
VHRDEEPDDEGEDAPRELAHGVDADTTGHCAGDCEHAATGKCDRIRLEAGERREEVPQEQLRTEPPMSLAILAASLGYADQAHFSRDFRRMVGRTPRGFAQWQSAHPAASQSGQ